MKNKCEKIPIITPCLNAEKYIHETVKSVIEQNAVLSGRVELEYIICDGGSTDRTLEILNSVKTNKMKILTGKDNGLYDALAKGLKIAKGDIIAYINAGDYYNKYAFDIVMDLFEKEDVQWLTGYQVRYNSKSYAVNFNLPYGYRKRLIKCGLYGPFSNFIQQESTFWAKELLDTIKYDELSNYKYAGDYYLWKKFANIAELYIAKAYLGGFRAVKNQISSNKKAYFSEMRRIADNITFIDKVLFIIDQITMRLPSRITDRINRNIIKYNCKTDNWE